MRGRDPPTSPSPSEIHMMGATDIVQWGRRVSSCAPLLTSNAGIAVCSSQGPIPDYLGLVNIADWIQLPFVERSVRLSVRWAETLERPLALLDFPWLNAHCGSGPSRHKSTCDRQVFLLFSFSGSTWSSRTAPYRNLQCL